MYKMLLVDDRKIFLRTVRRMPFFRDHEEEIRIEWETCRADSALEILRKEHVDIVMTDIRMPMMSGIDLLKAIRRENLCSCTILMSEYTDFAYAREGILHGAFDYIVKPLEEKELEGTLTRALAHLQKNDLMREPEMAAAEGLAGMLFKNSTKEIENGLQAIESYVMSEKDPLDRMQKIRKINSRILQSLLTGYPFLESYVPLETLFSSPDTASESDVREALLRLSRSLLFLHRKAPLFHTGSANVQVQNIWFYMIGNVDESCRLTETAQRFFLNPSYLSSLFKKETGISYKAFLQDLRMERARFLLGNTEKKVSEIAAQLHFTDSEYFRKSFRSYTGISPAKFDYEKYIDAAVSGK